MNWYAVSVVAVVGGALAALVQWWPVRPGCAGCAGPQCVCPTAAVAGTVTVEGILLGAALGMAVAVSLQLLAVRERARRRRHGEE